MKAKKTELNVDFIGGIEHLTIEQERAISEYLRSKKNRKTKTATVTKNTRKTPVLA